MIYLLYIILKNNWVRIIFRNLWNRNRTNERNRKEKETQFQEINHYSIIKQNFFTQGALVTIYSLVLKKNRLIPLEFLQMIVVVCNQQVFSLVSKPKFSDSAKHTSHLVPCKR